MSVRFSSSAGANALAGAPSRVNTRLSLLSVDMKASFQVEVAILPGNSRDPLCTLLYPLSYGPFRARRDSNPRPKNGRSSPPTENYRDPGTIDAECRSAP